MSNNYDDYNNAKTGKRQVVLPDPNKDDLICNDCINKELMEAKRQRDEDLKKMESQNDVQDRLNNVRQKQIANKVQDRIKRSEEAAKNLRKNQEKDKLIKNNEQGVFFLNDPRYLGDDAVRRRVMDNYNKKQRNLNRSFDAGRSKVDDYYKNYVDNYKEDAKQDDNKKRFNKNSYNNDLEDQIISRQKLRARRKNEEDQKVNKEKEKQDEDYFKKRNEEMQKKQKLNNDFMEGNKNLMALRAKKKQQEKDDQDAYDRKKAKQLEKELEEEQRRKQDEENQKRIRLQQDLEKQMNEKAKRKALEKVKETGIIPKNTFGGCTCDGNGICSFCKKSYPLKYLNPVDSYAEIAKRRRKMDNQRNNTPNNYTYQKRPSNNYNYNRPETSNKPETGNRTFKKLRKYGDYY